MYFRYNGRVLGNLYAPGTGPIWLNYVQCVGNEMSIANCSHGGWGTHNCYHFEDVSVACGWPSVQYGWFSLLANSTVSPADFKQAAVLPLLKKGGSDASDPNSYRPVSNISFLSKLLERVVQKRLQVFLDSSGLMPARQSAYRRFHSTETAVTKVFNDLLLAADDGEISTLCLLDLTAAFDTVDHDLMLLKL